MIEGVVKGQALVLNYPTIVAETVGYLTAEFSFPYGDWSGFSIWAHFKKEEEIYSVQLKNGKIVEEDHLNLSEGMWEVYLHGTKTVDGEVEQRITTQSRPLVVMPCGILEGEPLPVTPPSVGEQILATARQALAVAQGVRDKATLYERDFANLLDEIIAMQEKLIGGAAE